MASRFDSVPRSAKTIVFFPTPHAFWKIAHLRTQPALQHDIEIAVAIDIGKRKRAAVFRHVEAAHAGEIVVASCPPREKQIAARAPPKL